jgi:hypothetical protein
MRQRVAQLEHCDLRHRRPKTAWREYIVFVKNIQASKEAALPSLFVICDVAFENRFLYVDRY